MVNWNEKNPLICYCHLVHKDEISSAIKNGAATLNDIRRITGACIDGNCVVNNPEHRCCSVDIVKLLKETE